MNVIFLRQFTRYNKQTIRSGQWFEISTVPFPAPIQEIFVTKILDYWNSGHYVHKRNLFYDKTSDLNGEKIKVVVLRHNPAVFGSGVDEETGAQKFIGIEIELLRTFADKLNFHPDYYETEDSSEEKWGNMFQNGTYTGLLGEMDNGLADIALADLHYTIYHLEIMDLSIPYNTECLTFLTPESASDNSWQTLILPFSEGMWIGVGVSLFCVGIVFYLFSNLYYYFGEPKKNKKPQESQKFSWIWMKESLFEIPLKTKIFFKRTANKIASCCKRKPKEEKKVLILEIKVKKKASILVNYSTAVSRALVLENILLIQ